MVFLKTFRYVQPPGTFSAGMKIEAVDPLNLASVCVATVMQVRNSDEKLCINLNYFDNDKY